MSHAAIAPTAQRLAEENNVDWRSLRGSGASGEVLERDVLAYLARVMRGEEATDPTPEPVPEGVSAWPEEPERRNSADDLFSAAFRASTPPAPSTPPEPTPELDPWASAQPEPDPVRQQEPEAFAFAEPGPVPQGVLEDSADDWDAGTEAEFIEPTEADFGAPEGATAASAQTSSEELRAVQGVPESVHQAALRELETLKARLASLEEERLRHLGELHQLSRMQETIALQKNESAKFTAAQSEVQRLKAELAAARGEAQHGATLEAKTRDLQTRLDRARTFRKNAKAEYERLMADNMMLEHEVADLKKRRSFKFWEK